MKSLQDHAIEIVDRKWLTHEVDMEHQKRELDHFKVLYNAGLLDQIPKATDGRSLMQALNEDVCGWCGTTKHRGEWCLNARCDSQLRRKR